MKKKLLHLSLEFLIIPLFLSIFIGPFIIEFACKYRKESVLKIRVMELQNEVDIPLSNIDIIFEELDTYRTDSLGYCTIRVKNNKSVVPLISCNTCKDTLIITCAVKLNGVTKTGKCNINVNQSSSEQTEIVYVK